MRLQPRSPGTPPLPTLDVRFFLSLSCALSFRLCVLPSLLEEHLQKGLGTRGTQNVPVALGLLLPGQESVGDPQ